MAYFNSRRNLQPSRYLSPDLPSSSASSFEISYSRFKNSSPVISSPLFPPLHLSSSSAPVQTLYRKPSRVPGISVPVVLGGSCISSVGVANTARLCVGKTSVPTRHCSALIWGWEGGGGGGAAYRYIIQLVSVKNVEVFTFPHPSIYLITLINTINKIST